MSKVVLLGIMALFGAQGIFAQTTAIRVDPTPVFTISSRVAGTNPPILGVSGAAISVCSYPANAVPCTNLAQTYTDATMAVSCPTYTQLVLATTSICTANTDVQGNFGFWIAAGTYSYTITVQGSSYGPYYVTAGGASGAQAYVAPFTGAITTTVNAKIAQANLSLADFCGAAGTVPLSSSTCWAKAQTAAAVTNQQLYVPAGIYAVDAPLVVNTPLQMSCDSGAIFQGSATGQMMTISSSNVSMRNCAMTHKYNESGFTGGEISILSTTGNISNILLSHMAFSDSQSTHINIGGGSNLVQNVYIQDGSTFTGTTSGGGDIGVYHGAQNVFIRGNVFAQVDTTANTDQIQIVENQSSVVTVQEIYIEDNVFNAGTPTGAGKFSVEVGNFNVSSVQIPGIHIFHNVLNFVGVTLGGFSLGDNNTLSDISENTVYANGYGNGACGSGILEAANNVSHSSINNNKIFGLPTSYAGCGAIGLNGANDITVTGNKMVNGGIYLGSSQWVNPVANNLISGNYIDMSAVSCGSYTPAIWFQHNLPASSAVLYKDNQIKNNVIIGPGSGQCTGVRVDVANSGNVITNTDISGNHFTGVYYGVVSVNNNGTISNSSVCGNFYTTIGNANVGGQITPVQQCDSGQNWLTAAHLGSNAALTNTNVVVGAGLGTGGTAVPSTFNTNTDQSGTLALTSGTSGYTNGLLATVTFSKAFAHAANCVVQVYSPTLTLTEVATSATQFLVYGTPTAASTTWYVAFACPGI